MPKKKRPKKITPTETVHFRPGQWLGQMIADHAAAWNVSRGTAAKRLVGLAACGLADTSYGEVEELRQISISSFETALQHVYVEIVQKERHEGQVLVADERHAVLCEVLQRYRLLHVHNRETDEPRHVKVKQSEK